MKNSICCRGVKFHAPTLSNKMTVIPTIILLTLIFFSVIPAYAQESAVTDDEVNAVAKRMYCPECENIPLDVCGTAACVQWRQEIRTQLEEGQTPEQIIDYFVARFGDRVVGTPQDPMLRNLSLITPWIVGIVALGVVAAVFLRWRKNRVSATAYGIPATPVGHGAVVTDDDYRQRIEHDLLARR